MKPEVWKPVAEYVEVSNRGRVKILKHQVKQRHRICTFKEKIVSIRKFIKRNTYPVVNIKGKWHYIHHLVVKAFITENFECVDHKNGIKWDNRVENLRPCTIKENNKWAYEQGLKTTHKTFVEGGKKTRFKKGNIPWNKGIKYSEERRQKCIEAWKKRKEVSNVKI